MASFTTSSCENSGRFVSKSTIYTIEYERSKSQHTTLVKDADRHRKRLRKKGVYQDLVYHAQNVGLSRDLGNLEQCVQGI